MCEVNSFPTGARSHRLAGTLRRYHRHAGLSRDTLVYDPALDTWSRAAPIPTPREHLAGFVHDGEVWALGGRALSLSSNFAVVEIYDPAANAWRTGPALTMPHGGFAAAVLDGVAYAVGGEEPARALDTAEALDLPDGAWRTIAPVPTPRHGHAMAAAAGRVWVIGGADAPIFAAVDAVESFAPTR
jgi:non-specific serine/threonine protein kinase